MQNEKSPHERRQAALQIATILTAILFVGWIATLGVRLATNPIADENTVQLVANVEAGIEAVQGGVGQGSYYQNPQNR